ncbi:flavodoxin [Achromobacter marplatensis]|uniref:Flavodoxin-like domain-containing protein n=1 Tax=Achromobacter marplatensis TaxID=470868 RepID=A0AA43B2S8_9BURK|nr:flavodoxin [Achromobacter marplatensis]MDH2052039.1 hypothetical protein [Achromobacter marplatensis]
MTVAHDSTRRTVMAALVALPLGAATTASNAQGGEMRQLGSRTLVVYFSRSGNTRVVAGLIHRARGTDLFEIRPASAYPEDYEQTVEQARKQTESGYRPPLEATAPAIAGYDTAATGQGTASQCWQTMRRRRGSSMVSSLKWTRSGGRWNA